MRKKTDLIETEETTRYSFHKQDRNFTGKGASNERRWKYIALILGVLLLFCINKLYNEPKAPTEAGSIKEKTIAMKAPTKENFLECYSDFQAVAKHKKLTDEEKVYAGKLAQIQYAIVMEQLNNLPHPTKQNVEEMRRKVYNINWMLIESYDNICVYYSDGPLTKNYFQSKLAYVREIADVYKSMGYPEERIYELLGDSPGNYYGIKN